MKTVNKKRNKNLINLLEHLADPKESKLLIVPNRKGKKRTSANLDEMIRILIKEVLSEIEAKTLPRGGAGGRPRGLSASLGYYNPEDKFRILNEKFVKFEKHFNKIFNFNSEEVLKGVTKEILEEILEKVKEDDNKKSELEEMVEVLKEIKDLFIEIIEPSISLYDDKNARDTHEEKNKQIIEPFKKLEEEEKFKKFNFASNNAEIIFVAAGSSREEANQLSKMTAIMSNYLERIESKEFIEPIKLDDKFQNEIDEFLSKLDKSILKPEEKKYISQKISKLRILARRGDTIQTKDQEFKEIKDEYNELLQAKLEPSATTQNVPKTPPGIFGKIGSGVSGALARFKQLFTEYKDIPDEVLLEMLKRANISEQILIEITGCKRYSLKEAMEKGYD